MVTNNISLAERLLKLGARIFANHYLLHYCVRKNMQEMVEVLVQNGDNINMRDISGWTPLLLAIREHNNVLIQYLIERGSVINRDEYVMKELHIAIQESQNIEQFRFVATLLLLNGVKIDSNNYWGEPPLLHAIAMEKYQMAELLIKEGANVMENNDRCLDILLLARRERNITLMKLLGK